MQIPLTHQAGVRVILHRAGADVDVTSRVRSITINTGDVSSVGTGNLGSDAVVSTMTLEFDLANQPNAPSLAPGAISPLNNPRPLLRPYRRVTITAGQPGQQQFPLFVGYLGDDIRINQSVHTGTISVTARDIAKPFQDTFLETFPTLGGTPATVPSVLQQLIDLVPPEHRPDLVVPVPPGIGVETAYQPTETTIWDVMQQLVNRIGWYLGARGNDLVLLDPPRGPALADKFVDADDFYSIDHTISDTDLRNRITIYYSPSGSVTHTDTASVNDVTDGIIKHSIIKYAPDSPIKTAAAANDVAMAFLNDMSRPHTLTRLTLPFLPDLKVFDMLGVNHPSVSADQLILSIHSVQHQITRDGKARTTVLGTDRATGGHTTWLRQETKPGGN